MKLLLTIGKYHLVALVYSMVLAFVLTIVLGLMKFTEAEIMVAALLCYPASLAYLLWKGIK